MIATRIECLPSDWPREAAIRSHPSDALARASRGITGHIQLRSGQTESSQFVCRIRFCLRKDTDRVCAALRRSRDWLYEERGCVPSVFEGNGRHTSVGCGSPNGRGRLCKRSSPEIEGPPGCVKSEHSTCGRRPPIHHFFSVGSAAFFAAAAQSPATTVRIFFASMCFWNAYFTCSGVRFEIAFSCFA